MYIQDGLYKKILEKTIVQTLDIVFLSREMKILLWLRNNSPLKWVYYIPWWRRHKNETIYQSAIRKSKEELGIDIDPSRLVFLWVYDDIFNDSAFDNISTHCSPITFVYKLDQNEEKNLNLDSQHSDFKFFDIDDENIHDMVKIRINDMKKQGIV